MSELLGQPTEAPFGANVTAVSSTTAVTGTADKVPDTAIIGATLRAPLRAANDLECVDLCANWIDQCELVVVGALLPAVGL